MLSDARSSESPPGWPSACSRIAAPSSARGCFGFGCSTSSNVVCASAKLYFSRNSSPSLHLGVGVHRIGRERAVERLERVLEQLRIVDAEVLARRSRRRRARRSSRFEPPDVVVDVDELVELLHRGRAVAAVEARARARLSCAVRLSARARRRRGRTRFRPARACRARAAPRRACSRARCLLSPPCRAAPSLRLRRICRSSRTRARGSRCASTHWRVGRGNLARGCAIASWYLPVRSASRPSSMSCAPPAAQARASSEEHSAHRRASTATAS